MRAAPYIALSFLAVACGRAPDATICERLLPAEQRMEAAKQSLDPNVNASVRVFASLTVADSCVTIRARQLAQASDAADIVGRAVASDCAAVIERVASSQYQADEAAGDRGTLFDPVTGQPTNYTAWARQKYERIALAAVVAARAGGCRA